MRRLMYVEDKTAAEVAELVATGPSGVARNAK
jgi:hypothetical protein